MSNFIEYTYHHTCKYAQEAYVLKSSPFKSVKRKSRNGNWKIPFLGEGFYLWEENVEAGIRWGIKHCENKYCVVEFVDVKIETRYLLNFLDRRDMKYFKELINLYISERPQCEKWALGNWIEFFKKMQQMDKDLFPFKFIRAEENLPDLIENDSLKQKMYFAQGQKYYTYTSPLLMICVINKSDLNFKSKAVIKQSA